MSYMRDITGRRLDTFEVAEVGTVDSAIAVVDDRLLARSIDEANAAPPALVANTYATMVPTIAVPPTDRPVTLKYGGTIQVTTGGAGALSIALFDMTVIGSVKLIQQARAAGTFVAGSQSALVNLGNVYPSLEPSTSWRYYRLSAGYFRDAASALVAVVPASGAAVSFFADNYQSYYLEAVKE